MPASQVCGRRRIPFGGAWVDVQDEYGRARVVTGGSVSACGRSRRAHATGAVSVSPSRTAPKLNRPWPSLGVHLSPGLTVVSAASTSLTGWRSRKFRKLARISEVAGVEPNGSQGTTTPIRMDSGVFPVADQLV